MIAIAINNKSIKLLIKGILMSIFDSIGGALRKIGRALTGGLSVLTGFGIDLLSRIIGLPGFLFDFLGYWIFDFRLKKYIKIRFFVLADERGALVAPIENIVPTLELTTKILREQGNIIVKPRGKLVAYGAPDSALNISAPTTGFFQLASSAGEFLNGLAGFGPLTTIVSVIVVNDMTDDDGRSYGASTNFVLVHKKHFAAIDTPNNTVAHEIAHSCLLNPKHRKQKINLMHGTLDGRGDELTNFQVSVMRTSRFVWYF